MSESTYTKQALPEWQKKHPNARVMRNNTAGAYQGKILTFSLNGIAKKILSDIRLIFFGIGIAVKDKKTGRTKQVGGGDWIGWESVNVSGPCCGSCVINESCNLLYNQLYPSYKKSGLIYIYQKLKNCFCEGKLYRPDNIKKLAIFLNLEIKSENGKESPEQIKFRKAVIEAGGISEILQEGKNAQKI